MERSENLTPEPICNENTSDFVKMTGDGAQEIVTVTEETETETVTDELDRETGIPTTMLTPPPTGEPLLLNGSSRSSTSGNDLQQFTGDGDGDGDDGHSNHSANSDSVDSKPLIINEGPEDSIENASGDVDRKTIDDCSIDSGAAAAATTTIEDEDNVEEKGEQNNEDGDNKVEEAAAAATTTTEELYDECSRLQANECDTNPEDETLSIGNIPADQVITNDGDDDIAVDNDVIDGESRQEIETYSYRKCNS